MKKKYIIPAFIVIGILATITFKLSIYIYDLPLNITLAQAIAGLNSTDGPNIVHVANSGSDTNTGKSNSPVKTVGRAVSILDAQSVHDGQIIVHGINYVDTSSEIKPSSDSTRTLMIIPGQGESVVFDGSVSVSPTPLNGVSGVYLINTTYSSPNIPSVWHESKKIRYNPVSSMEVLKASDYGIYPYGPNVLAIHPKDGILPDSSDLRVSVSDSAFIITRSNVTIKDISFRGFAKTYYSAGLTIGANNNNLYIDNIRLQNIDVKNSYSGIYTMKSIYLKKIVIDNCNISDVSSGINAHGGDVEITNCKIINDASASNLFAFRQADQYMGGAGINVRDNYGLNGSKYNYNVIKGFQHGIALQATINPDNGAGYSKYEIQHNTIVLNLDDITNAGSSMGIQFSRYVGAGCDKCGPEKALFMYNIIDGFAIPWSINKSGSAIATFATIDKNVLWNSAISKSTYEKSFAEPSFDKGVGTNLIADPMFVNRDAFDYRIFSSSEATNISAGALSVVNGGSVATDFRIDVPTISNQQKMVSSNVYDVTGSSISMNIIPYDVAGSINTKITISPGTNESIYHKFVNTENITLPTLVGTYVITVTIDNGQGKFSVPHTITVNKKSSDVSLGNNYVRANKYGFLVINKTGQSDSQYISYRKKGTTSWTKGFDGSVYTKAYYVDTKDTGNQGLYVSGLESDQDYEFQITNNQGVTSPIYTARTAGEPTTIYVSPQGVDDFSRGLSSALPLKTLQFALDMSLPGDTIRLTSGVYIGPSIIMHSGLSNAHIKIVGDDSSSVVLSGGNTYNTVLSLENASFIDVDSISIQGVIGAGIYCSKCTNVTISNNKFINKHISGSASSALGNAIYVGGGSDISIHHNLIRNWSYGIQAWSSPRIKINNNTLVAMTQAAVNLNSNCLDSEVTYNTINFMINSAMIIYASPSDRARIQIDYNNLAGDISTARGIPDKDTSFKKLYLYNNASYFSSTRELADYNSLVNSPDTVQFASFKDWKDDTGWDTHSIFADPMWVDPLADDFRLKSGSPNILSNGKYIGAFPLAQNVVVGSNTDRIYVSTSGSDTSGDGSSAKPFKTIQKAVDLAIAGDTIYVKNGKYDGNIIIKNSGSNKPIRLEGESLDATIDSGVRYTNWQLANDVGNGVYKIPLSNHPSIITIDDFKIPLVDDSEMSMTKSTDQEYDPNITALQIMKGDYNISIPLGYPITGVSSIKFWDAFYGIAGYMNGYLYVKLKDGSNPNTRNILVHNAQTGLSINGSNVEIKNLSINGFGIGIKISGSNVVVDQNVIRNSDVRINLFGSGSNNTIKNNKILMNNYGASPGAWSSGSTYEAGLKEFIYIFYKYMVGSSSSADTGISMSSSQDNLSINNNDIYGGLVAMSIGSRGALSNNGKIYENIIHANSSVGITEQGGLIDFQIYSNTIFDNNSNIRIHNLDSSDYRRVYIYNNKMYQIGNVGNQFFLHAFTQSPRPSKNPENYIYHNSISGGESSICPDAYVQEYGGVPNFYFVNNIFSSKLLMCNTRLYDLKSGLGIFDYNWVSGKTFPSEWYGDKNVSSGGVNMWSVDSVPNFSLISGTAKSIGLDISKANTVSGKNLNAMLGAKDGYFSGFKPDAGYTPGLTGDTFRVDEFVIQNGQCSTVINQCLAGSFQDEIDSSVKNIWSCLGINGGLKAMCSVDKSNLNTLYVSTSGSDTSGDGSSAKPFSTLQKAIDVAVAGDRIFIKAGIYDGRRITLKNSGSAGKPIVIEGETSSSGERLVTLDGGEAMTGWVSAPEIGDGVYKIANKVSPVSSSINDIPYVVVVDGKYVDPLKSNNYMDMSIEWKKYITLDQNAEVTADNPEHAQSNPALLGKVKFWDVTKAIFYATKEYTYMRLADKSNPNNHTVRGAFYVPGYWSYDTLVIKDKSYITIKNINFRTYNNAISVRGSDAHDIVITNNKVESLRVGIEVQSGAHDIDISNNEIPLLHFGASFGAWGGSETMTGSQRYEYDLKQAIYQWYHHWIFNSSSFMGISLSAYAGNNIDVGNNKITDGFIAIDVTAEKSSPMNNIRVHDNYISRFSSGAIYARGALVNLEIYNNVTNDANYGVRNHELDMNATRKVYIYNNWFTNPAHVGNGIFFHYLSGNPVPTNPPEIYIYHNNFLGGKNGLNFDAYVSEYGGAKGMVVLNNIISSGDYDLTGANAPEKDFFGAFDYNTIDNISPAYTTRNWFGPNNIVRKNVSEPRIMTTDSGPGTKISSDSKAYKNGLDLSKSLSINGRTIVSLPGINPGYFSGKAPDIGVIANLDSLVLSSLPFYFSTSLDKAISYKLYAAEYNGHLTFSLVTQPSHGITTMRSDGTFTYNPNAGWTGRDFFTYKVSDGTTDSNISMVTIDVERKTVSLVQGNDTISSSDNNNLSGQAQKIPGAPTILPDGRIVQQTPSRLPTSYSSISIGYQGTGTIKIASSELSKEDITLIQEVLVKKNLLSSTSYTKGVEDRATKEAIKKLETANGIKGSATGLSSETLSLVNTLLNQNSNVATVFREPLSISDQGDKVKKLQEVLVAQGLLEERYVTGKYGPLTEEAVKKLQTRYNISNPSSPSYGSVGPGTRALLNELLAKPGATKPVVTNKPVIATTAPSSSSFSLPTTIYPGTRSQSVGTLQTFLISKNYLTIQAPTSYYGNLTRQAVGRFQIDNKIVSDSSSPGYGNVGPKTLKVLNSGSWVGVTQ